MDNLRNDILNFKFKNKKLIYINGNTVQFKTAVSKSDAFKNSDLYSRIFKYTSFLPLEANVFQRLYAIYFKIKEIPKCKICKKINCTLNNSKRLDYGLFNKTCGRKECQRKCRSNGMHMNSQIKYNHSISMHKYKNNLIKLYQNFIDKYNSLKNISSVINNDQVLTFIKLRIEKRIKNGQLIKDNDYIENENILFQILNQTHFIELPNAIKSKQDFEWPQRLYCLINNLDSIPKCKFCNENNTKFNSFNKGYFENCGKCIGDSYRKTLGYPTLNEIKKSIDQEKYYILQFPKSTENEQLIIKCKKCNCISKHYLYNGRGKNITNMKLCNVCDKYSSLDENLIFNFIKEICQNDIFLKETKDIISPLELDIYNESKKIAIEYDGFYWHNDNMKNNSYHVKKTNLCNDKNIQLIHIFENEWIYKNDIVKSRLKNIFGVYDNIIFARKCQIKEITNIESRIFQNENHLQGAINSKVNIGLFYNDEQVSLMTFGKCRFDKKHEWEMLRFCNKLGYHIPGGASKLLKYFEKNYQPKSLVSYADRRWSQGKLYEKLGFKLDHISRPDYWYFKNDDYRLLSRINFQKHKLPKILEKFDENKSEVQNMKDNGYYRIFDCGNLVFEKIYESYDYNI